MSRNNILTDDAAREKFIDACLALKAEPIAGTQFSFYDYFPHWHLRAMNYWTPANQRSRNAAHGGPSFGPWHRLMLLVFESLSRQVLGDAGFQVPYWDWAADAANPAASEIWSVIGGDGVASQNNAVLEGPFRASEFRVNLTDGLTNGSLIPVNPSRALRRNFNRSEVPLVGKAGVQQIIDDFPLYERLPYRNTVLSSFRQELEVPMHNTVHRFVSGDMETSASPNDPVFFLHHCNIDRIWADWQDQTGGEYVPGNTASNALLMHRLGDQMHNYFGITLPISAMVDYQRFYEYDTLR